MSLGLGPTPAAAPGRRACGGGLCPRHPLWRPSPTAVAARRRGMQVRASASGGNGGGRQSWDIGRFARTVLTFNPPPSPGDVLAALTGASRKQVASDTAVQLLGSGQAAGTSSPRGSVLVLGATGGVGRRVVQRLLMRGYHVRALVRDIAKARRMLGNLSMAAGGSLEAVEGNLALPNGLPLGFAGSCRRCIICSAAIVTPKEGDTPDRQKYMQGIKFYDPEVVGGTPKQVEYEGIMRLLEGIKEQVGLEKGKTILDPSDKGQGMLAWAPLDDVVMGGVSESGLEVVAGAGEVGAPAGIFSGIVSSSNSGGFASVRTRTFNPLLDLGAYEGLSLRIKGDGQRYKCMIRTDTNWDGIAYCQSFDTLVGEWQTVELPFAKFAPIFRAKTVQNAAPLNPSSVASIQMMLSKFEYDGNLNPAFSAGGFCLPITCLAAYLPRPVAPRVVHVSSAGVTRPMRPGINLDQEPPAVRLNDELNGLLTWKLAGEDAVRAAGAPYAIVRPCALTEEPAGAELVVDQGDNLKGKISRDDVADLCVALLDTPSASGVTFEIKSTVPFSQPYTVDPANPPPPQDWSSLLAPLKPGITGKHVPDDSKQTQRTRDPLPVA